MVCGWQTSQTMPANKENAKKRCNRNVEDMQQMLKTARGREECGVQILEGSELEGGSEGSEGVEASEGSCARVSTT